MTLGMDFIYLLVAAWMCMVAWFSKARLPSDDNGDDWKEDDGHVRWGLNEQTCDWCVPGIRKKR